MTRAATLSHRARRELRARPLTGKDVAALRKLARQRLARRGGVLVVPTARELAAWTLLANEQGVTVAEWLRDAGRERLGRIRLAQLSRRVAVTLEGRLG